MPFWRGRLGPDGRCSERRSGRGLATRTLRQSCAPSRIGVLAEQACQQQFSARSSTCGRGLWVCRRAGTQAGGVWAQLLRLDADSNPNTVVGVGDHDESPAVAADHYTCAVVGVGDEDRLGVVGSDWRVPGVRPTCRVMRRRRWQLQPRRGCWQQRRPQPWPWF